MSDDGWPINQNEPNNIAYDDGWQSPPPFFPRAQPRPSLAPLSLYNAQRSFSNIPERYTPRESTPSNYRQPPHLNARPPSLNTRSSDIAIRPPLPMGNGHKPQYNIRERRLGSNGERAIGQQEKNLPAQPSSLGVGFGPYQKSPHQTSNERRRGFESDGESLRGVGLREEAQAVKKLAVGDVVDVKRESGDEEWHKVKSDGEVKLDVKQGVQQIMKQGVENDVKPTLKQVTTECKPQPMRGFKPDLKPDIKHNSGMPDLKLSLHARHPPGPGANNRPPWATTGQAARFDLPDLPYNPSTHSSKTESDSSGSDTSTERGPSAADTLTHATRGTSATTSEARHAISPPTISRDEMLNMTRQSASHASASSGQRLPEIQRWVESTGAPFPSPMSVPRGIVSAQSAKLPVPAVAKLHMLSVMETGRPVPGAFVAPAPTQTTNDVFKRPPDKPTSPTAASLLAVLTSSPTTNVAPASTPANLEPEPARPLSPPTVNIISPTPAPDRSDHDERTAALWAAHTSLFQATAALGAAGLFVAPMTIATVQASLWRHLDGVNDDEAMLSVAAALKHIHSPPAPAKNLCEKGPARYDRAVCDGCHELSAAKAALEAGGMWCAARIVASVVDVVWYRLRAGPEGDGDVSVRVGGILRSLASESVCEA